MNYLIRADIHVSLAIEADSEAEAEKLGREQLKAIASEIVTEEDHIEAEVTHFVRAYKIPGKHD